MSDPLTPACAYCGSPEVIDDAWWCGNVECERAAFADTPRWGMDLGDLWASVAPAVVLGEEHEA
jgi:hypothetical protein